MHGVSQQSSHQLEQVLISAIDPHQGQSRATRVGRIMCFDHCDALANLPYEESCVHNVFFHNSNDFELTCLGNNFLPLNGHVTCNVRAKVSSVHCAVGTSRILTSKLDGKNRKPSDNTLTAVSAAISTCSWHNVHLIFVEYMIKMMTIIQLVYDV